MLIETVGREYFLLELIETYRPIIGSRVHRLPERARAREHSDSSRVALSEVPRVYRGAAVKDRLRRTATPLEWISFIDRL